MTKEQALEKKLEQTKWQFPNHVVFKHNVKVFHFDPDNFDRDNIFTQTGLKVLREKGGNVALYDPEYFGVDHYGGLVYKGTATERIPQPINLKRYNYVFYKCKCETIDLSDWDFSGVISVRRMFQECEAKTIILGNVDLNMCMEFRGCFFCCDSLEELILGNYVVLPDINTVDMFANCDRLSRRYNKTARELADIFKSGQWNSLQQKMMVF